MVRMHKLFSSLIAFILMVKFKAYQPLNPDDPNYFPPYECQNQPRQKVVLYSIYLYKHYLNF